MNTRQPSVSFHTLGCKLNFAETSTLARQLKAAGFQKAEFGHGADVVVINTCSVTENADRECRTIIRRALAMNSGTYIVVTGCYAQLKPQEIASMEGVDLVLGATEKFNIQDYLGSFTKKENAEVHSCEIEEARGFHASYATGDRTRAFLKVQDGCDYTCSYCTIPLARGASRSDTIDNIVRTARQIAADGVREIVLTGVNIGDFGLTGGIRQENFFDLVRALEEVDNIHRFRISSIEPNLLKDEIIEFVAASKRFVPHFHIPLQSGSDRVLGQMRRRYRRDLYSNRIAKIRQVLPDACIGADVIVGFPGEGENEFLETYQFLNDLGVSYLHVFTYSERDHTEATGMKEVVPITIRKQRNKMLRILSEKKLRHFYESQLGKTLDVLFESENRNGWMHGFTRNYVKVKTPFDPALENQVLPVHLLSIDAEMNVDVQLPQFA